MDVLSNVSTSQIHEHEYPNSYLLPNGNVFIIGPQEDASYELNVGTQTWTQVGGSSGVVNGGSVMYRPGKILYTGGAASLAITTSPARANAAVIDLTSADPQWQSISPMALPACLQHAADARRRNGPGGRWRARPASRGEGISAGVLPTEIWDPTTEPWTTGASMAVTRSYHTTRVLLPTGQVLVGRQRASPAWRAGAVLGADLLAALSLQGPAPDDHLGAQRPTYGSNITVTTPNASSITAVNLVVLGADTHQMDFDQHFVPLSFTASSGSLTVQMPVHGSRTRRPGNYMLFIRQQRAASPRSPHDRPQLSRPPQPLPSAPTGVTATAGSGTATVSWTAPAQRQQPDHELHGHALHRRPAQTPTVVSGNPPATSATVGGLTNGEHLHVHGDRDQRRGHRTRVASVERGHTGGAHRAWGAYWRDRNRGECLGHRELDARPPNGGSPISSYTVTPYLGSTAQTTTTVTGSPPAATATVTGLTNGQSYTFTVAATNAVGTSPPSAPSNAVTPSLVTPPAFVQQASTHVGSASSISVTPSQPLGSGNRLVVEVGAWSGSNATTTSVTDSAGDTFTEVSNFVGPDKTQQSVWTAPITASAGNTPTITAKFSSAASAAIAALEYSGLSTAAGSAAVDQEATASGTTSAAGTVSSGPTAATTAGNELAIGFYSDSGFGDTLTAGSGYTARTNISDTGDMELLAEDQVVGAGATPGAAVGTGAKTIWEMATVVFKAGSQAPPTAPNAPTGVTATAGNASAVVSWTAPASNGSPITSYTVTPYVGTTAQTPTVVTGTPPATSTSVTGLTNGTTYTFQVSATNGVGTGQASAPSNQVEPTVPTAPAVPTNVAATAGNESATVSWSAPANGGSPITMYTVTPYLAGVAQSATVVSGSPPATTANVAGLTNGDAYTFTVSATNAIGTGPASAQSQPVTPTATVAPGVRPAGNRARVGQDQHLGHDAGLTSRPETGSWWRWPTGVPVKPRSPASLTRPATRSPRWPRRQPPTGPT